MFQDGAMVKARVVAVGAVLVASSLVAFLVIDSTEERGASEPAPTTRSSPPTSTTSTSTTAVTTTTTVTTTTLAPDVVRIAEELNLLGIDGQARQVVMLGVRGDLVEGLIAELGDACIGGVFVAGNAGNWEPRDSFDAAKAAIEQLAGAAAGCSSYPLVATDAEAGTRVLKVPVSPLPDPATLEANHQVDPATTSEGLAPGAEAFARQLAQAGVHVNFGVVADVDVGAGYYMDRQRRSFGDDPATVTAITEALVEGHCRAGVAATLKHFPNQGSTVEDPHELDSFSATTPAEWAEFGAQPYRDTRAPLVMTGHIRFEGVDGGLPATLSTEITSWLRSDLGYSGVIVTDDMHVMRGVGVDLSPGERAVAALRAGADLALFVGVDNGAEIVEAIVAEAQADPMFATRLSEAAARVLRLKGGLGLLPGADADWFEWCGTRAE